MEITIDQRGIEAVLRQLDPKHGYEIIMRWYDAGTRLVRDEMRSRATSKRVAARVTIKLDSLRPPRWARIRSKSPLAHLLEGGTGALGASGFKHVARHWPSTQGIMRQTGLPQAEAFLVARAIGLRGGNRAQPFVQPTYLAVRGRVERMAEDAAREVLR